MSGQVETNLGAYSRRMATNHAPIWLFGKRLRLLAYNPPAALLTPKLFGVDLKPNDFATSTSEWSEVLEKALRGEHWRLERRLSDDRWFRFSLEPQTDFAPAVEMRAHEVSDEKKRFIESRMREAMRRLLAEVETVDDESLPQWILQRIAALSGAEFACIVIQDSQRTRKKSLVTHSFLARDGFNLVPYRLVDGKIAVTGPGFEFLWMDYASSVGFEAIFRLDGEKKLLIGGQKFGKKSFSQPLLEDIVLALCRKASTRLWI